MIGGEYFLNTPSTTKDSLGEFLHGGLGKISFFASGRDALATVLSGLPQSDVLLPDLMCASIYNACLAAQKTCTTYRIGEDFLSDGYALAGVNKPIVFVIHYFGVLNEALMRSARNAGLTVISDVTHLLFDRVGMLEVARNSDFLVASLRKSGPFPDGGFVSSLQHCPPVPARGLREDFVGLRAAGLWSRGMSAAQAFSDDENLRLLKFAEARLDATAPADFACSRLSVMLTHTIAYGSSASAIRRNIGVLNAGLREYVFLPISGSLISPYFPCVFETREIRDRVRSTLATRRLFFPVHWPSVGLPVPSLLATRSLSIPCDARYDESAMKSIITILKSCLNY